MHFKTQMVVTKLVVTLIIYNMFVDVCVWSVNSLHWLWVMFSFQLLYTLCETMVQALLNYDVMFPTVLKLYNSSNLPARLNCAAFLPTALKLLCDSRNLPTWLNCAAFLPTALKLLCDSSNLPDWLNCAAFLPTALKLLCNSSNLPDWLNCAAFLPTALKLLCDSSNLPALLNCAHGKDRTGIVSALVLSCLGKSPEYIAAEYALSAVSLHCVIKCFCYHCSSVDTQKERCGSFFHVEVEPIFKGHTKIQQRLSLKTVVLGEGQSLNEVERGREMQWCVKSLVRVNHSMRWKEEGKCSDVSSPWWGSMRWKEEGKCSDVASPWWGSMRWKEEGKCSDVASPWWGSVRWKEEGKCSGVTSPWWGSVRWKEEGKCSGVTSPWWGNAVMWQVFGEGQWCDKSLVRDQWGGNREMQWCEKRGGAWWGISEVETGWEMEWCKNGCWISQTLLNKSTSIYWFISLIFHPTSDWKWMDSDIDSNCFFVVICYCVICPWQF